MYLQDPSTSFILDNSQTLVDLANVTAEEFSVRLGQLINTYILDGLAYRVIASGTGSERYLPNRTTTVTFTHLEEVYVCSWGWLTMLMISIFALLAVALLSAWYSMKTVIPDVLRYCSSMTRDSRQLDVRGGGTLDGMERARLLSNFEVRLGVTHETNDGIGSLVLASPGMVSRPDRGRLYT